MDPVKRDSPEHASLMRRLATLKVLEDADREHQRKLEQEGLERDAMTRARQALARFFLAVDFVQRTLFIVGLAATLIDLALAWKDGTLLGARGVELRHYFALLALWEGARFSARWLERRFDETSPPVIRWGIELIHCVSVVLAFLFCLAWLGVPTGWAFQRWNRVSIFLALTFGYGFRAKLRAIP